MTIEFKYNDGGREASGRKGKTGDCVTRALAIATGRDYAEIYDRLAAGTANQRKSKYNRLAGQRTARKGLYTRHKWFKDYMAELGFTWTPTMQIGQGCKVHVRRDELPSGRLVLNLSRHSAAVIDGVLHDTYDSSRSGTRCVYGYWRLAD